MNSISKDELRDQLADAVLMFVKDKIELIMREEMSNFKNVEQPESSSRNGYYSRTFDTRYGKIDDLQVPRDRGNEFSNASL